MWLFEQLCADAAKNVAAANEAIKGPAEGHDAFSITTGDALVITRAKDACKVRFSKQQVSIMVTGNGPMIRILVDIDNRGECVAVVDDAVLMRWQVLQRALGNLFFG